MHLIRLQFARSVWSASGLPALSIMPILHHNPPPPASKSGTKLHALQTLRAAGRPLRSVRLMWFDRLLKHIFFSSDFDVTGVKIADDEPSFN
jgi:hypothetical protein